MKLWEIQISLISAGIVCLLIIACTKDPDIEITNIDVSDVTETTANISWQVSADAYSSTMLSIYEESDPVGSERSFTISENKTTTIDIDGLKGLTKYGYSIALLNESSEEIAKSNEKTFKTTYTKEKIELRTEDSLTLKGQITYFASRQSRVPGIIMMHGLGDVMGQWYNSEMMELLIPEGYACMAFFFRNHGNSDTWDGEFKSIEGLRVLGYDTDAAINYMKNHERVDSENIGLMGGSMGGMTAVHGNLHPNVRTSVSLSPTDGYVEYLSVFPEYQQYNLASIYYIVGEYNFLGDYPFPSASQTLFDATEEPRKLWIITGSSSHATALLFHPGVNESIVDWIKEQMPSPI